MPAQLNKTRVNLLPTDRFEYSKVGRFLQWTLTTGRYLVVFTEMIVIAAFLSRFWFDRTLTDLRESRIKKENIVDSFQQVLNDFLRTQSQLKTIRTILSSQYGVNDHLGQIQSLTNSGIEYDTMSMSSDSARVKGFASSADILSTYLSTLQASPVFDSVSLKTLGISADRAPGMDFELELHYAALKPKEGQPS